MEWLWWYLFGLFSGIALTYLVQVLKKRSISFRWYEWVLAFLAFATILFAVQTFFGSYAEQEPKAAWLSLVALGIPAAILITITARLVQARARKLTTGA